MTACAKCKSTEVHVIAIAMRIGAQIPTGWGSNAAVDHHVCTNCGYVEMYISDREVLDKIARKWPVE